MIYLRARWYNPADGRFQSRDTWGGDQNSPMSFNRWNYVEGNPINHIDPTGHITQKEGIHADNITARLQLKGVYIYKDWGNQFVYTPYAREVTCAWKIGRWDIRDLENIDDAAKDLEKALGGFGKIQAAVGKVTINKGFLNDHMMSPPGIWDRFFGGDILVQKTADSTNDPWFKFTIVHEFGHVWDYRNGRQLSSGLMKLTGGSFCSFPDPTGNNNGCNPVTYPLIELPPEYPQKCIAPIPADEEYCKNYIPYSYSNTGGGIGTENWAQALAYYVYEDYLKNDVIGLDNVRRLYVKKQIANLP